MRNQGSRVKSRRVLNAFWYFNNTSHFISCIPPIPPIYAIYKDDLFFNSPLAHLDMLSAKYFLSDYSKEMVKAADLDVVLVQSSHGYTSILCHVDMSVLAHVRYLLWGHCLSAILDCLLKRSMDHIQPVKENIPSLSVIS